MKFITSVYCDVGSRKINEDTLLLHVVKTRRGRVLIAAVADGIGGLNDGEKASGYLCECISNIFFNEIIPMYEKHKSNKKIVRGMLRSLYDVNSSFNRYALQRDRKLGTTMSLIIILGKKYFIFHIGDTRIYLCKPNEIKLLTEDHVDAGGRLTKCIGSFRFMEPDIKEGNVRKNIGFLIASDGYYALMRNEKEIFNPQNIFEEEQINSRLKQMGTIINECKQRDNASAIYVGIK